MESTEQDVLKFDLIMLGGGISASLLAINLLKKNKNIQIAIVEKSIEFNQKIGESTSDITAICLRSMGIDHLLKDLIPKTGLRFLYNEKIQEIFQTKANFQVRVFKANTRVFKSTVKI
ncbi:MAG: tryptophan 7-halogenase [Crocinitomicaceae bacterium]|nr:tryptophan 7-halogenase [Crocinitomicaceae bacterium]